MPKSHCSTPAHWSLWSLAPLVACVAVACVAAPPQPAPPTGTPSSFGAPLPASAPRERAPAPPTPGPALDTPAPAAKSGGVAHHKSAHPVSASPGAVWPNDPALLRLEQERAALEMVDHAASQALQDATRRIAAMHVFMQEQGLASLYAAFIATHVPNGDQLTFDDAVDRAIDQQRTTQARPQTNDLAQLEQATEVEAGVARSTWNRLNQSRRTVAMIAEFLAQQRLLDYYQGWAPGFMRSKGWAPQGPAAGLGPDTAAIHRRALQLEWERAHRQQRAARNDAPPAIAPPPARGPESNSWFNGYADPYYDLAGFPGRDPDADHSNEPASYGWAPEAYSGTRSPTYWDLGPNVVPGFGAMPSGAAGGAGFGAAPAGGAR